MRDDQEYLVKAGDQVTVTLPGGVSTTPGVIASVASVASADNAGAAAGSSPGPSSGSGSSRETVQITVRLTRPGDAGHLDQAPVSVDIVSARACGVLAVPVSALVALAGGDTQPTWRRAKARRASEAHLSPRQGTPRERGACPSPGPSA